MDAITANTFEKRYSIAKKRYRILAFLIDFSLYAFIGYATAVFFGTVQEDGVSYTMNGLPAFSMMILALILWPVSEGIWGQTIGKRLLDLKVMTTDFKPIGLGQAFVRFFVGFFDYIFLAIGLIVATFNKQNKRIGDLTADTIVVRTKPIHNNI